MRREWTIEEEEFLEKWYEKRGVDFFVKRLNRTPQSVKRKAQKMGLNAYICQELYVRTIAKAFNCDSRVINRWIDKYDLKYRKVVRGQSTCKLIDPVHFWKWAELHKDLIPWSKYERYTILPEPEWISESIKNYEYKNNRKTITDIDISRVVNLRNKGYTFKQISLETNRTLDSVKHIWKSYTRRKSKNAKTL